jgi:excisionase family DNA binding protein
MKSNMDHASRGHISRGKELYTLADVCSVLNISLPTAKRWLHDGKLFAHRVGGRWMVPVEELRRFLRYKEVALEPLQYANSPIQDDEAAKIAALLAAVLREVGGPFRSDTLKKMVTGTIQPGPAFWRFLDRVLSAPAAQSGE